MAENLQGVIVSYRRGPRTQSPRECLLRFPGVHSAGEAARLIGREVAWPVGERRARGRVVGLHGRGGLVRARFRRGVPGWALGSPVEIIG